MRRQWPFSRVFYGWWVVTAAFFVALYVGGVVFYGFTTMFEPIVAEFGWSYTQVSLAASLRGLESSLLAPIMGTLADRWGPRRLLFMGAFALAGGLFLLSQVNSLGMFYVAFFLVSIGMSCCSMTVLMTAVANWFHRRVGLASGIAISGFGFGGLVVPLMVALIDKYDWRLTVVIISLGMLAVVLPLSLLVRHKPEHYGYLPDGAAKASAVVTSGPDPLPPAEIDIRVRQALKSGTFWHITLAYTIHILLVAALVTHVMPYLSSLNIARSTSGLVATGIPVVSIGGRLSMGWLGDKFSRKAVTAGGFIMMALGILCFAYADRAAWLLIPFLILFGSGYGGNSAMRPSLVREFFGRAQFGTLLGLIMGINMLGNVAGPPIAGWVFDTWGSYQGIWLVFAGLGLVSTISMLTTPPVKTG
ncbi:MAG: MFS transporter [Chloroflexota bacterium]